MATITKRQIRTVRGMAAQVLDGGDDAYRDFLVGTYPDKDWSDPDRPSTLDLSKHEANRLITILKRMRGDDDVQPWEGRYQGAGSKRQAKHLTQSQADEIARLEYELGWMGNPRRVMRFIKRQIGRIKKVSQLSKREATTIITGLRKVQADTNDA